VIEAQKKKRATAVSLFGDIMQGVVFNCPIDGCRRGFTTVSLVEDHSFYEHRDPSDGTYGCVFCRVYVSRDTFMKCHKISSSRCSDQHRQRVQDHVAAAELFEDALELSSPMAISESMQPEDNLPSHAQRARFFSDLGEKTGSSFFASLGTSILELYNSSTVTSEFHPPRAGMDKENIYRPYPNATVMLLATFAQVVKLTHKDVKLLLRCVFLPIIFSCSHLPAEGSLRTARST
jgi:hypothetical protein